jgi:hypothetical protein
MIEDIIVRDVADAPIAQLAPGVRLRSESNCGEYIVQRFCAEFATDVSKVSQLS